MPVEKLEEDIEKYSAKCIDINNNVIQNDECKSMLNYLQGMMLPKSRNAKIRQSVVNKK